jgi:hypothetical protein
MVSSGVGGVAMDQLCHRKSGLRSSKTGICLAALSGASLRVFQ